MNAIKGSEISGNGRLQMMFGNIYKRFIFASILWAVFWPLLWYIKIGDITGPKAWFWIVGELSYPVVAVAYLILDNVIQYFKLKPWLVFVTALLIIVALMPAYYKRYGFALGVSIEARYF